MAHVQTISQYFPIRYIFRRFREKELRHSGHDSPKHFLPLKWKPSGMTIDGKQLPVVRKVLAVVDLAHYRKKT